MSCFCHKLFSKQYSNISTTESAILQQAWSEAPHLFLVVAACPKTRKRKKSSQLCLDWPAEPAPQATLFPPSISSPSQLLPFPSAEQPQSSVVGNLVNTYVEQDAAIQIPSSLQRLCEYGINTRVFLAVEQIDQEISHQIAFRRIYSVAFAQQHQSCTSIAPIVKEIEYELPGTQGVNGKVKRMLHIGNKWLAIIRTFASVVDTVPEHLTGLISLLSSASVWERAGPKAWASALAKLHETTDLYVRTKKITPSVNSFLKDVHTKRPFVNETHRFTSDTMALHKLTNRSLHTLQGTLPVWLAPAIAASSRSAPQLSNVHNNDIHIILALLSFFATGREVPPDLLLRAATPRMRWTVQGETEEVDAAESGLCPQLQSLLSDVSRVRNAIRELSSLSVVSFADQACSLSEQVASSVRENLPAEQTVFWKRQALLITYRAIPWKHIESPVADITSFLPHLEHSISALEGDFDCLSTNVRADLALTLLEASRFPTMRWKRFAVGQSEAVAHGLDHPYLRLCVARSRCVLARLDGKMEQAVSSLQHRDHDKSKYPNDKRLHSAVGHIHIQQALNYIQTEAMSAAQAVLEQWSPIGQSSSMENILLVRKHMLLGRVSRYMGNFKDSLAHLESARSTTERVGAALFDEDLSDLTCELSDTLRELDDPVSAERHLRIELARRQQRCSTATGCSSLQLSLAEALFAQNRLAEATALCREVQSRVKLLKFENLRLHFILAKIYHIESKFKEAFSCWSRAMDAIGKYPLTNGRLTCVIILSICDTLGHLGHTESIQGSMKAIDDLDKLENPDSVQHWIAGTRHWLSFLNLRRSCL
ncbi:hypothetical protein Alg130_10587 [Pyrenophora tritici-repentis]|nr:hypothetical protein Alg130_10587 [Pyrenophora tritici-repentis]